MGRLSQRAETGSANARGQKHEHAVEELRDAGVSRLQGEEHLRKTKPGPIGLGKDFSLSPIGVPWRLLNRRGCDHSLQGWL